MGIDIIHPKPTADGWIRNGITTLIYLFWTYIMKNNHNKTNSVTFSTNVLIYQQHCTKHGLINDLQKVN